MNNNVELLSVYRSENRKISPQNEQMTQPRDRIHLKFNSFLNFYRQ